MKSKSKRKTKIRIGNLKPRNPLVKIVMTKSVQKHKDRKKEQKQKHIEED